MLPVPELPPTKVQLNVYGAVPPVAFALKVTAVPTVPLLGPPMTTANASGLIGTVALAVAVFAGLDESVPVTVIVLLPFTLYVVLKLLPVPDDGLPPGAEAVKVTGDPTVGLLLTVKLTPRASALIVTVAEAVALTPFASVAVTLIV